MGAVKNTAPIPFLNTENVLERSYSFVSIGVHLDISIKADNIDNFADLIRGIEQFQVRRLDFAIGLSR